MLEARDVWVEAAARLLEVSTWRCGRAASGADRPQRRRQVDAAAAALRRAEPTRGEARSMAEALLGFSAAELARRRAVVPQASVLTFPFTVLEVTMLGVTVPGFDAVRPVEHQRVEMALERRSTCRFADRFFAPVRRRAPARAHRPRPVPARCGRTQRARRGASCSTSRPPASTWRIRRRCWPPCAGRPDQGHVVLAVLHDLNLAAALADHLCCSPQPSRGEWRPSQGGAARRPAVGRLWVPGGTNQTSPRRAPVRAPPGRPFQRTGTGKLTVGRVGRRHGDPLLRDAQRGRQEWRCASGEDRVQPHGQAGAAAGQLALAG